MKSITQILKNLSIPFAIFILLVLTRECSKLSYQSIIIITICSLPVRVKSNIYSIFGGFNNIGSVYSIFGLIQSAKGNAFSIMGICLYQNSGNNSKQYCGFVVYQNSEKLSIQNFGIAIIQKSEGEIFQFAGITIYQTARILIKKSFGISCIQTAITIKSFVCISGKQTADLIEEYLNLAIIQHSKNCICY